MFRKLRAWKSPPRGVGRRGRFVVGTLSAGESLAAGADGGATVQLYEKIEPQKYPWGWIRWLMNARIDPQAEMTLGLVRVEAHQSNPRHVHANSAEFLHVISGTCQQHIGDRWVSMKTGDTVRIPQGVPHSARTDDQPLLAVIVYNTGTRQMKVVE